MRKTMATDDRLKGVGQEETSERGSWSGKGARRGLGGGEGLTLDEVRSMASEAMAATTARAAERQKYRRGVRGMGPAVRLRDGGERRLAGLPDD